MNVLPEGGLSPCKRSVHCNIILTSCHLILPTHNNDVKTITIISDMFTGHNVNVNVQIFNNHHLIDHLLSTWMVLGLGLILLPPADLGLSLATGGRDEK